MIDPELIGDELDELHTDELIALMEGDDRDPEQILWPDPAPDAHLEMAYEDRVSGAYEVEPPDWS